MEFKHKVKLRQKNNAAKNKQKAGFVRVKVRGRKRWIKPESKKTDNADASA